MFITGHTNEDNAKVVNDYPYGRHRTKIRYWIESNQRGDRFVSQTLKPFTDHWNNPRKSTYSDVMVMTEDERGYISYIQYSVAYTDEKSLLNFVDKVKDVKLNSFQFLKSGNIFLMRLFRIPQKRNPTRSRQIKKRQWKNLSIFLHIII